MAECQVLSADCHLPNARRGFNRRPQPPASKRRRRQSQGGYILLTLLLFVALLTIFATAVEETIKQQILRDREEELIHRGVQYSRAVRHYYKKFGRYPTRIEDLESTNTIRFLRKRYKDPMTGKDFKLLHQGEVQMSFGAGMQGGAALNALAAGGAGGAQSVQAMAAGIAAAQAAAAPASQTNLNSSDSDADSSGATPGAGPGQAGPGSASGTSPVGSGQVFGGGPIVGVVSTSKETSIRSFNKKDHYNQWQFIYDPTSDRGGLLMTPNQPPLNITNNNQNAAGQPGTSQPGSGIGSGFGNQPTSPGTPPAQQPAQPDTPQQ
jgi:type II secretory pathway pseudopilin PulG